jgi:hypothetical protein
MFASNLSINDAAAVSKTFNLISQDGQTTVRSDISVTDPAQPRLCTIRHQVIRKGDQITARHNVVFAKTIQDAQGNDITATASLVVSVPRETGMTQAAVVEDLVVFIKNLMTSANLTILLRGES